MGDNHIRDYFLQQHTAALLRGTDKSLVSLSLFASGQEDRLLRAFGELDHLDYVHYRALAHAMHTRGARPSYRRILQCPPVSPFHLADQLVERGADANMLNALLADDAAPTPPKDHRGGTLLHAAVHANNLEALRWLLAHGADAKVAVRNTTPLAIAAGRGLDAAARILLAHDPGLAVDNLLLRGVPTPVFVGRNERVSMGPLVEAGAPDLDHAIPIMQMRRCGLFLRSCRVHTKHRYPHGDARRALQAQALYRLTGTALLPPEMLLPLMNVLGVPEGLLLEVERCDRTYFAASPTLARPPKRRRRE